jgi:hypothetical protein
VLSTREGGPSRSGRTILREPFERGTPRTLETRSLINLVSRAIWKHHAAFWNQVPVHMVLFIHTVSRVAAFCPFVPSHCIQLDSRTPFGLDSKALHRPHGPGARPHRCQLHGSRHGIQKRGAFAFWGQIAGPAGGTRSGFTLVNAF